MAIGAVTATSAKTAASAYQRRRRDARRQARTSTVSFVRDMKLLLLAPWSIVKIPCLGTRESTQVAGLDAQRHAGSGLPSQHFDDSVARRTEHLDVRRRVERLRVRGCGALGDDLHVKRHRVGIR